ncbi:adenylate cyclase NT domain protein, partial [Vibrio parahaemolyticus V-223/04]
TTTLTFHSACTGLNSILSNSNSSTTYNSPLASHSRRQKSQRSWAYIPWVVRHRLVKVLPAI